MIPLLAIGTLLMVSALGLDRLLPRGAHEARRRLLLGSMVVCALLPFSRSFTPETSVTFTTSHHLTGVAPSLMTPWALEVLFIVWLLGALWRGVRLVQAALSLCFLQAHTRSMNRRQRSALRRAMPALSERLADRIRLAPGLVSPCVVPFGRGRVLLPVSHRTWDPTTLACVMGHELEHLRRGDAWWSLLTEIFRILWWFHPWAHRIAAEWTLQCEHLCDAAALRTGASPETYARALLHLANGEQRLAGALSFAGGQPSKLRTRVERVLQAGRSGAAECGYLGWLALVMMLAMGVAAFVVRSARQNEAQHHALIETEAHMRMAANPFPAGE